MYIQHASPHRIEVLRIRRDTGGKPMAAPSGRSLRTRDRVICSMSGSASAVRQHCRFELKCTGSSGSGPGWSTRQIELTLSPKRIIGLEASEAVKLRRPRPAAHLAVHSARCSHRQSAFPVDHADFIFRFDAKYSCISCVPASSIAAPRVALESWASAAISGTTLAELHASTHSASPAAIPSPHPASLAQ